MQGQIGDLGAARSKFRESETGSGYWLLRQMILAARKGGTKFGLQPFQNPFSIYDWRFTIYAIPDWRGGRRTVLLVFFNSFLLASLGQYFTVEPRE